MGKVILTEVRHDLQDSIVRKIHNWQDRLESDSILPFFDHRDPTYRYLAARAFGSTKDPAGIDSLVSHLQDPIREVRLVAAYALGQIGHEKAEQELIKKAKAGELIERSAKEAPPKSENLRTFNVFVDDEYFEVGVEALDGAAAVNYVRPMQAPAALAPVPPQPTPAAQNPPEPMPSPVAEASAKPAASVDGTSLIAPMPGMIISSVAGETVRVPVIR